MVLAGLRRSRSAGRSWDSRSAPHRRSITSGTSTGRSTTCTARSSPGCAREAGADSACRVAMYSPYSALFREELLGRYPHLAVRRWARSRSSRRSRSMLLSPSARRGARRTSCSSPGLTPLLVSAHDVAIISATRLGVFCKTCVGIYISSVLLAVGGDLGVPRGPQGARRARGLVQRGAARVPRRTGRGEKAQTRRETGRGAHRAEGAPAVDEAGQGRAAAPAQPAHRRPAALPAWLVALGVFAVMPALLYVSALPSYASYMTGCGKLEKPTEPNNVAASTSRARARSSRRRSSSIPLCPTCKAFHQRLVAEGVLRQARHDARALPARQRVQLDARPAAPPGRVPRLEGDPLQRTGGAMRRARVGLREPGRPARGRQGRGGPRQRCRRHDPRQRWPGPRRSASTRRRRSSGSSASCASSVENKLPVSTPQLFLGGTRLCDEDTRHRHVVRAQRSSRRRSTKCGHERRR